MEDTGKSPIAHWENLPVKNTFLPLEWYVVDIFEVGLVKELRN